MERFLDLSLDLMAISDLDTRILVASASFSRIGWDREAVLGQRVMDLIHPEDLGLAGEKLAGLLEGREAAAVTLRLRGGDGAYRWVQGNAMIDLGIERIYFTGADITPRKELEDQLLERVRLEELVATVAAGLLGAEVLEPPEVDDAIEDALGRIAAALGADGAYFLRDAKRRRDVVFVEWAADRPGRRDADRIPPSDAARRWWSTRLADGHPLFVEDVTALGPEAAEAGEVLLGMGVRSLVLVPLHQHRFFNGFIGLVTSTPHRFSDDVPALLRVAGESFMGVLRQADATTALIDARRELEQRNADLERSNEDLERFAYAAAHDLKAPLARIEMALAATPDDPTATEELLDIARRASVRMRRLIEDLLTYASVGVGPRVSTRVDLDEVLTEVLNDVAPAIEAAGIRVERAPLPPVPGVRPLLGQLLQNLVSNSVKFARSDVDSVVRIEGRSSDDGVTLSVIDNGIGIDSSQRSEVFGVFTRLQSDDRYPGSGIGLATCAKVVSHHGGRIWLSDGIDGGCSVNVWLPNDRR